MERALEIARHENFVAHKGVYVAVTGPNLETRAEYRFLRLIGADVVGMSTVPEVLVAVHGGMRVLGLSIVTDICLPDHLEPVEHPRNSRRRRHSGTQAAQNRAGHIVARAESELIKSPRPSSQASVEDRLTLVFVRVFPWQRIAPGFRPQELSESRDVSDPFGIEIEFFAFRGDERVIATRAS